MTPSNKSIHFLDLLSCNLFPIFLQIVWFARSIWPWLWGCLGLPRTCWILYRSQMLETAEFTNSLPLSVCRIFGAPSICIIFMRHLHTSPELFVFVANAYMNFENESTGPKGTGKIKFFTQALFGVTQVYLLQEFTVFLGVCLGSLFCRKTHLIGWFLKIFSQYAPVLNGVHYSIDYY